jgi:gamma-glutamylcyclotransferase (GGCT)/AIG2-like uncharacterized protein YtfP
MAALVPGIEPLRVEGDVFDIPDAAIAAIDELETGSADFQGPYVRERITVVSLNGARTFAAEAYVAREPSRWQTLVDLGEAEALEAYPRDLAVSAVLKDCCARSPGHPPPHDVIDPLASLALG